MIAWPIDWLDIKECVFAINNSIFQFDNLIFFSFLKIKCIYVSLVSVVMYLINCLEKLYILLLEARLMLSLLFAGVLQVYRRLSEVLGLSDESMVLSVFIGKMSVMAKLSFPL